MTAGAPPPPQGRLGQPLIRLGAVGSTNDLARRLAETAAPEGTVVVADCQTHGRGRLGRPWASPLGGLWCSVVLRPAGARASAGLSLAVAVAAAEAIEAVASVQVDIRWPNDLLVAGRKVGGLLLEGVGGGVIVGIGINANVPSEALPADVAARATSLHLAAGRPVDREALLEAVLGRLGHWYGVWATDRAAVLAAWARRDLLRGAPVRVGPPGRTVEGTADGVDDDGALRVRLATGEVQRVVAGDVAVWSPTPGAV